MKISNKLYDILKWIVITVSPALIAFITGLGALYGFPTEIITGTIALVTAFVGALIGVSSIAYHRDEYEDEDEDDE